MVPVTGVCKAARRIEWAGAEGSKSSVEGSGVKPSFQFYSFNGDERWRCSGNSGVFEERSMMIEDSDRRRRSLSVAVRRVVSCFEGKHSPDAVMQSGNSRTLHFCATMLETDAGDRMELFLRPAVWSWGGGGTLDVCRVGSSTRLGRWVQVKESSDSQTGVLFKVTLKQLKT